MSGISFLYTIKTAGDMSWNNPISLNILCENPFLGTNNMEIIFLAAKEFP